jgi:hypothetical protein
MSDHPCAPREPFPARDCETPSSIEGPPLQLNGCRLIPLAQGTDLCFQAGIRIVVENPADAPPTTWWFATNPFLHPSEALEFALKQGRTLQAATTPPSPARRPRWSVFR